MSQHPSQTNGQFSTQLSQAAFTRALQDFISDGREEFATQTGVPEQTTQQEASTYYPAEGDSLYGGHPGQSYEPYPEYGAPLPDSPSPWAQDSLPDPNQEYHAQQLEVSELTHAGAAGALYPLDSINASVQQSIQGTINDQGQALEPTQNTSKQAVKRTSRKENVVKYENGQLWVQIRNTFKRAVYHKDLRAEYIAKAPPELYDHPPKRGKDALDVTSFHEGHRTWGFRSRAQRPEVCFSWLPSDCKVTAIPGPLMHNHCIVIDLDGHPVRGFEIPFCLSSEIEGGRLEAMSRENGNRISKRDFRARMPPTFLNAKDEVKGLVTEQALAMRRQRFRNQAALVSQHPRDGSLDKKIALIQCIPADVMARILTSNSVRCWRDMTKQEIKYLESVNAGQRPDKAGSKVLSEEVRKDRMTTTNLKLVDLRLVNETAWPYLEGLDTEAISRARASLGLPPLDPRHLSTQGVFNEPNYRTEPNSFQSALGSASINNNATEARRKQGTSLRPRSRAEPSRPNGPTNEDATAHNIANGDISRADTTRAPYSRSSQISISEGKKRSRDEVSDQFEQQYHAAGNKRRRGSAESNKNSVQPWNATSDWGNTYMPLSPTEPEAMPLLNSAFEQEWDGTIPDLSSPRFAEPTPALTYTSTPTDSAPQFGTPSFDQAVEWEATDVDTAAASPSAEEQEHIDRLKSSSPITPLEFHEEHLPLAGMTNTCYIRHLPQTALEYAEGQSSGDATATTAHFSGTAGMGDRWQSPAIKKDAEDTIRHDLSHISTNDMSVAPPGTSASRPLIKMEEGSDSEVPLSSIPQHTAIANAGSYAEVEWEDGYPIWS